MARTSTEIQDQIIAAIQGDDNLNGATSPSSTAIWRTISRIVAGAILSLEKLFDLYRDNLIADVEALRPSRPKWYQQKALGFQYGSDLPEDAIEYDNSSLTDDQVNAQKIVAVAAVTASDGVVKVKVAKKLNGVLTKLLTVEYDALVFYFKEIKDAGVEVEVINETGDRLVLEYDVYYDPLVLTENGDRIDGTANGVVKSAINDFLENLPFNGLYVNAHMTDRIQSVDGVYVPVLKRAEAGKDDATSLTQINVQYLPFAGYLRFADVNTDLVINYKSMGDV